MRKRDNARHHYVGEIQRETHVHVIPDLFTFKGAFEYVNGRICANAGVLSVSDSSTYREERNSNLKVHGTTASPTLPLQRDFHVSVITLKNNNKKDSSNFKKLTTIEKEILLLKYSHLCSIFLYGTSAICSHIHFFSKIEFKSSMTLKKKKERNAGSCICC